jgi:AcrR family transcriptional regulator
MEAKAGRERRVRGGVASAAGRKGGEGSVGAEGGSDQVPDAVFRRVPRPDRGQRRVEQLLEAAAEVIGEVGVDAATTNAIAARAGTSVGSLYQFFPNKDAIVQALAARYESQMAELNVAAMGGPGAADLPIRELMSRIVKPMATFFQQNPAYRHVFYATVASVGPGCSRYDTELKVALRDRIMGLVGARLPGLRRRDLEVYAIVAMEVVHTLLAASDMTPELRAPLVRETINVMSCYFGELEQRNR